MGSIYARGRKLWLRFKGSDGKWTQTGTEYRIGQEDQARKLLKQVEIRLAAGADFGEREQGPVTVARFMERWIRSRKDIIADWRKDEARLRRHVLRHLGGMQIDAVRPRHLVDVFKELRAKGQLAPKTIYNIYGVLKALFRDAQIADLIHTSPCILTKY